MKKSKKSKSISLKAMWERAAKAPRVDSPSPSTSRPQVISIESHAEAQGTLAQPEAAAAREPETEIAVVPNDQISVEPEVASNEPQLTTTVAETEPSEPSPLSPIRDGEFDYESSGEAVYDIDSLHHDPGKRRPIRRHPVNERNSVIRGYIALGPCQPRNHDFPIRLIGGKPRRFIPWWFDEFTWLEYSVELDAAFCFVCFLFKHKTNCSSGDAFVSGGFRNWHLKKRIERHCGSVDSYHNMALEKYNSFMRPKATIVENFASTTQKEKCEYKSRLTYSLKCLKFLLRQGLACRGHDESEDSLNKGNFLELLNWLAENFEEVAKVVLKSAPKNCTLTAPKIQKDIINSCAKETTKLIMEDLGSDYFAILADESSDVYDKEQLALCLRYVDKKGKVVERFLGVVHVENTASLTLKDAIQSLLMEHSLSLSMIRGQGYDGASNMKGHANGLKKLIMDECPSAYYVHCFAHQLQLTLVAVAKENSDCDWFFDQLKLLLNLIGNSCKKVQMLRVEQAQRIVEELELDVIQSGKGQNQEMSLCRPGDTRWGSHYKTVMRVLSMYPSIRKVIKKVGTDKTQKTEYNQAQTMLTIFDSFEFVFMAHLMQNVLGYTADLNHALQKRDQDIVNAVELIYLTKIQLQHMREDDGWDEFLKDVHSFCNKHKIKIPDMDNFYRPVGRDRRFYVKIKNMHRFHVDMFLSIIDRQLQELNNRFDEVNTDLLVCMSAFNPANSFAAFDKASLVKLAQFYPNDFSRLELDHLPRQLQLFITDMREDEKFKQVNSLAELSVMLVSEKKHTKHDLVYRLLKLVLVLPVATATVERVFSIMNYVKNKLRNRMGDHSAVAHLPRPDRIRAVRHLPQLTVVTLTAGGSQVSVWSHQSSETRDATRRARDRSPTRRLDASATASAGPPPPPRQLETPEGKRDRNHGSLTRGVLCTGPARRCHAPGLYSAASFTPPASSASQSRPPPLPCLRENLTAHHQALASEAISPATERNEDAPGGPRPGGGRARGPCCGGEARNGSGGQDGGGAAAGGPRGEEGGGGGEPAPALGVRAEGLHDPLPAVHPHRGRRRHGLPRAPHPALLRLRTSGRRLANVHRHPHLPAHRHVPHAQVQGEAPQEPRPARAVHALLQPQHRRVRVHHSRHCGSAGYYPHSCCCSGADRLHLLGCQEGLRLQLHLPIPVHQPPGTSGVPHHPALLPAGKGGHDHLRVPGHPGVLGLHRLRHPHAAQASHLQRVRGRRHLPLPGRHQPLHGPDVALLPVIDCQSRLTPLDASPVCLVHGGSHSHHIASQV